MGILASNDWDGPQDKVRSEQEMTRVDHKAANAR